VNTTNIGATVEVVGVEMSVDCSQHLIMLQRESLETPEMAEKITVLLVTSKFLHSKSAIFSKLLVVM